MSETGFDRAETEHRERALGTLSFGTLVLLAGQLVISPLLPTITEAFEITVNRRSCGIERRIGLTK